VATTGEGVDELLAAFDDHAEYLRRSGEREQRALSRYATEIRRLVRADVDDLLEAELRGRGGTDELARGVLEGETDPYAVAQSVVEPLRECLEERADDD
jgi:LAO/AO transport system kinase